MDRLHLTSLRVKLYCLLFFSYTYYPCKRYCINRAKEPTTSSLKGYVDTKCLLATSCLPNLGRISSGYIMISCLTHLYGVIQSIPLIIMYESPLSIDLKWNCYICGRLGMHPSAVRQTPYFVLLTSLMNLLWRYSNTYMRKEYRLDAIIFLLEDESRIKSFIKSVRYGTLKRYTKEKLSSEEQLFKIMFRERRGDPYRSRFYIRPNRTLIARRKLINKINQITGTVLVIMIGMISVGLPNILNVTVFDTGYILNYPGCNTDIENRLASGRGSRWAVSLYYANHRLICAIPDAVLNTCVYWDNLVTLLFPASLSLILAYDLMIYWKEIESKLDLALVDAIRRPAEPVYGYQADRFWSTRSSGWLKSNLFRLPDQLSDSGRELQQEMIDFFSQLNFYDKYVSTLVTFLFLTWTVTFVATNYMSLRSPDIEVLIILRALQTYACITLITPIMKLLLVRKATRDKYTLLMSIMAREQDTKRKLSWSQVIEHYTSRNLYGFTMIHGSPLTGISLLKYIGSSASFVVIIETLRKNWKSPRVDN